MRKFALIAALALFCGLCATAHADSDSDIGAFVSKYLFENESFMKEGVGDYFIIRIGHYEDTGLGADYVENATIIIEATNGTNGTSFRLVEESDEIYDVMSKKYANEGLSYDALYPTDAEIGEVWSYLEAFNQTRQPEEQACRLTTGTDRFPCIDRNSCLAACYTPMCHDAATSWEFVDAIWGFINATEEMDRGLWKAKVNLDSMKDKSKDLDSAITDSLDGMEQARQGSKGLTDNWLFTAYYFCAQLRLNSTALIMARVKVSGMRDRMAPLLMLSQEVESIKGTTAYRKAYFEALSSQNQDFPRREMVWQKLSDAQKRHISFVISSVLSVFGFIVS
jgi:hypothetical protein